MTEPLHFSAIEIARLQDRATDLWHRDSESEAAGVRPDGEPFYAMVVAEHRANFDLWHVEDRARIPGATDAERCDAMLLKTLRALALPNPDAELHSESPGLMIDRLSILALKIYHTQEEIERTNAPEGHAERNRERLTMLTEQRDDLVACLDRLWADVLAGKRRFKVYRQLKMYNDPTLNPAIYRSRD
jgi:hypothetical protein